MWHAVWGRSNILVRLLQYRTTLRQLMDDSEVLDYRVKLITDDLRHGDDCVSFSIPLSVSFS